MSPHSLRVPWHRHEHTGSRPSSGGPASRKPPRPDGRQGGASATFASSLRAPVTVRSPVPGEGTVIAALWQELCDAHEAWGGYPGSHEPGVYQAIAQRLDDAARARAFKSGAGPFRLGSSQTAPSPGLGAVPDQDLHLVADVGGEACGQIEGHVERHGGDPATPFTCTFQSLIVTEKARGLGAARALLGGLADSARRFSRGPACVLCGEVLEANPALGFYERVGYVPVAYSARMDAARGAYLTDGRPGFPTARHAIAKDALQIVRLDGILAARRRVAGDVRFDAPRNVEPKRVDAVAASLASVPAHELLNPATLVSVDSEGAVVGAAFFAVQDLDYPLAPSRRALLQCVSLEPTCAAAPVVRSIVAFACHLAQVQGARYLEVTDLSSPGTELYSAALAAGAAPWSRLMAKLA